MGIIFFQAPFSPDSKDLTHRLKLKFGTVLEAEFLCLLAEALSVARPQGVYLELERDELGRNGTTDIPWSIITSLFDCKSKVFLFIATCGMELEKWGKGLTEPLQRFWASEIMDMALDCAYQGVKERIIASERLANVAVLSPGAVDFWPVSKQRQLFTLLGEGPRLLGVRLTDENMMLPLKTLSGIMIPTEESFSECSFCDRQDCVDRQTTMSKSGMEGSDSRPCHRAYKKKLLG